MRTVLLALLLGAAACNTMRDEDPIIGCWQRPGEAYSIIFSTGGDASLTLSDAAASASVSYDFPRIHWRIHENRYALQFERTSLHRAYIAGARIEQSQLLIDGHPPLEKADHANCRGFH